MILGLFARETMGRQYEGVINWRAQAKMGCPFFMPAG